MSSKLFSFFYFLFQLLVVGKAKCLGWKAKNRQYYQWLTYDETLQRAQHFGSGLIKMGLSASSMVGIFAKNCPEWAIAEQALYCFSMVLVPIYKQLSQESKAFVINQSKLCRSIQSYPT